MPTKLLNIWVWMFFSKRLPLWHDISQSLIYVGGVSSSSHGSYLPIYSYHSFTHKKRLLILFLLLSSSLCGHIFWLYLSFFALHQLDFFFFASFLFFYLKNIYKKLFLFTKCYWLREFYLFSRNSAHTFTHLFYIFYLFVHIWTVIITDFPKKLSYAI